MKSIDMIASGGLVGSFAVYYANIQTGFINDLELPQTLFDWTVGGFPEVFVGLFGVRFMNHAGNLYSKIIENPTTKKIKKKILSKTLDTKLDNISENSSLYEILAASTIILGLGIIDETVYGWSGGTQDLTDIVKYGVGLGIGAYYNLKEK